MSDETPFEGRWLKFCTRGRWEYVSRRNLQTAAGAIATIQHDGGPHLVLVRQYRPPVGAAVLEFPAGLLEEGESPSGAAARELAEETGCLGRASDAGPFVYNSPGLTDEAVSMVHIDVTERADATPDPGESIEVVLVPLAGLKPRLLREASSGVRVDAKLWCFAEGLDRGASVSA